MVNEPQAPDDKLTQAVSIIGSIITSLLAIAASWNRLRGTSTDELTAKLGEVDKTLRDAAQWMDARFVDQDTETDAELAKIHDT